VTAASPLFERAALTGRIQPREGETPFSRIGGLPALLIAVVMLVVAIGEGRRRTN
jgi:apolipoprotein N-acyltransferase